MTAKRPWTLNFEPWAGLWTIFACRCIVSSLLVSSFKFQFSEFRKEMNSFRFLLILSLCCGFALQISGSEGEAEVDPARLAEINAIGKKDDEVSRGTLLKLIQDVNAAAAEREAGIKSIAQTRAGGMALIALARDEKLADEYKATASFACANSADPEVRTLGDKE